MIIEIFIGITVGILAGTFAGLIPGIHTNLLSMSIISASTFLLEYTSILTLISIIISMSITQSFTGVIPSTFLGAPDAENVLTALPAHRLLLKGKAYDAIRLTVVGSFGALIIGSILAPVMFIFMTYVYPFLSKHMFWVIFIPITFILFREKRRWYNLAFFLLSGSIGVLIFNTPGIQDPMFPLLSGLFGLSILITSFMDKIHIPKQEITQTIFLSKKEQAFALSGGFFAGALTSFLPGLGSSQGAVLAQAIFKKISEEGFLILIGGINTVNFMLSMIAYYAIEKARNGSIIAISTLIPTFNVQIIVVCMAIAIISGAIATKITLDITYFFTKIVQKMNYKVLTTFVIVLIVTMTLFFSGIIGFTILIICTALGIIATKNNIAKCHLMGCLLVPVLLYFW